MARRAALALAVLLAGGCGDAHDATLLCDESTSGGEDGDTRGMPVSFRVAAAKASPGVVSVYSIRTVTIGGLPHGAREDDPLHDLLRGMPFPHPGEFQQTGIGSGFLLDTDGYVLTSHHIIAGAERIEVQLADQRKITAEVVGTDPPTDIALLRIHATDLSAVELGDSDTLEVGDWVLAIGDPFGLPQTVSAGIVSAKGRMDVGIVEFEDFIQTDAAVNPGNSGGPLVDVDGRVVGINTAIATKSGSSAGIAFAIPSNMALRIASDLRARGKVVRGHLGLLVDQVPVEVASTLEVPGGGGLIVQDVRPGSAARKAGLRTGDIITHLDGEEVTTTTDFRAAIAAREPGTPVQLRIWRTGEVQNLSATLDEAARTTPGSAQSGAGLPGIFPRSLPQTEPPARRCSGPNVRSGTPFATSGCEPES